jgi:ribosomal 50S subunit-associated protein YjgA (DUF615 family)
MALPGWGQAVGVIASWIGTPVERLRKKIIILEKKVKDEEAIIMSRPQSMRDYTDFKRLSEELQKAKEELASKA